MQALQALAVPAIALLAAVIAVFQWRTAHYKVVIDLFDRRMTIYADCCKVLETIIISPNTTTDQDCLKFKVASANAEFLFGDEVIEHFKQIEDAILDIATYSTELKSANAGQDRHDLVVKMRSSIEIIGMFYKEEFRPLLRPYMRLKRGLRWW
jgi:hypothetical protein